MFTYIVVFLLSLIVVLIMTPAVKWLVLKLNILDKPNYRKIHELPVPLTGGLAIFLAFIVGLLLNNQGLKEYAWIVVAGVVFVLFGLLDDAGIKIRACF